MKKYGYVLIVLILILSGCGSHVTSPSNESTQVETSKPTITVGATGVFEPVKDTENNSTISFTNGWKQEVPDENMTIVVEVGNLKSDPRQGIVVVQNQRTGTGEVLAEKKFLTPSKHGSIKITSTNVFNFTIEAEDKTSFLFNVYNGFASVSNEVQNKEIAQDTNIKFQYFYRGFATVKYNMFDTYPVGTLILETDADWHDFMDKYVPGIPYYVAPDFSKELLVYIGRFPAKPNYSTGLDIKRFTISGNKLDTEYVMYENSGDANGIYAQNIDDIVHCFVNIVKISKSDIPQNMENIYHKK
ncbi:MAG: hypothetical protein ACYDGZ_28145 [Desulfosporosinus fructosivorans]